MLDGTLNYVMIYVFICEKGDDNYYLGSGHFIHRFVRDIMKVLLCSVPDHLRGLVVIVPGYRCRGPGSIPGATRFSEK
jgi:hypothetical protein